MSHSQYWAIFRRHVVRDLRRHKLLATVNVLSLALGIAVYLAIQIVNGSANRSFAAAVDLVAGKSTLEIRGEVPDRLLPEITRRDEVRAATPMIEGLVTLPDYPGEYLRVLGVDPFTNVEFRTFSIDGAIDSERWLRGPDTIALGQEFCRKHNLHPGDRLRVLVNGQLRSLEILSTLDLGDSPAGSGGRVAAMDIGWAQELFGMRGRLTSIQILLRAPEQAERVAAQIASALPDGATVGPPSQRSFQLQKMLSAFQLNLTALSMVSLLVGVFLIFNSISATVTRRRQEIGILRAIGASRSMVRGLFLGESLVFGVAGAVLGIGAGILLAHGMIGSVAKTISSLYVLVSMERAFVSPVHLIVAAGFGIVAALVGAWVPAQQAAGTDPVRVLHPGMPVETGEGRSSRWGIAAVVSIALGSGCGWAALATPIPAWSFASAFFVLVGFILLSPPAIGGASRLAARGVLLRLAAGNLRRSLRRNGPTVAALTSAIAMMIGLSTMIFSFRGSVETWIGNSIIADLYIAPASNEVIGLSAFIPEDAIGFLQKQEEVAAVDTFREVTTSVNGRAASLTAVPGIDRGNLRFRRGDREEIMRRFAAGEAVLVTESFARHFRVWEADLLTIATPSGEKRLPIAGIYRDYTRDRGLVAMEQNRFVQEWGDPRVHSLAVTLKDRGDAERVSARFREQFSASGEFAIYSSQVLRERILNIFDQTFAVTYLLRAIAVFVAVTGVFLSVSALVIEREREIGVLRAIGASAGQVQRLVIGEAGLIGAVSSVLGLLAGCALAIVLTWVVNVAFFGWTIDLEFPWGLLATTPLWIIAAAIVAAALPAVRAGRIAISTAVRSE